MLHIKPRVKSVLLFYLQNTTFGCMVIYTNLCPNMVSKGSLTVAAWIVKHMRRKFSIQTASHNALHLPAAVGSTSVFIPAYTEK